MAAISSNGLNAEVSKEVAAWWLVAGGQWPVVKVKALKPLPKKRSGVGWVGGISALFLRPEVIALVMWLCLVCFLNQHVEKRGGTSLRPAGGGRDLRPAAAK
jgi:hypothetical protein